MNSRIDRVLAALKEDGISQMLVVDPMSIFYMTGVMVIPMERFYGLLLKADGNHVFFLNKLFTIPEGVELEKEWFSDTDPVTEIVARHLDKNEKLGVDKDLKARFLLPLMECGAAAGFVNTSLAVDTTRGIKDEEEQAKMREASRINDEAMARFKTLIHAGVTEKEVAEQILPVYLELGAEAVSFRPIVSFGANAADPHHEPDDTVLKEGDCVLFDVGCIKDGYCSDMTRTFYYKYATDHCREIYDLVRRANEAAEAMIKPGTPIHVFDDTARALITNGGYGPEFNHRLGHFIGLSEHEYGDVSSANMTEAKPGMIFSI
ncbi:MAG: aminopeptidase P family protein, partial [Clostridiales bacterium]|nr:aminopeptidase P family protein [Candidatus Blautia equi]